MEPLSRGFAVAKSIQPAAESGPRAWRRVGRRFSGYAFLRASFFGIGQDRTELVKIALADGLQPLLLLAELAQRFLITGVPGLFECGFVNRIIGAPFCRVFFVGRLKAIQRRLLIRGERQAGDNFWWQNVVEQLAFAVRALMLGGRGVGGVVRQGQRQREAGQGYNRCGGCKFRSFHLVSGVGGWVADCW